MINCKMAPSSYVSCALSIKLILCDNNANKNFHESIAKKREHETLTGQPHIVCGCLTIRFISSARFRSCLRENKSAIRLYHYCYYYNIIFACINNKLISRAHSVYNATQSIFIYLDLFVSLRCLSHWCVSFAVDCCCCFCWWCCCCPVCSPTLLVSCHSFRFVVAGNVQYFERPSINCRLIA